MDISDTHDFSNQVAGHDGLLVAYDRPVKCQDGEQSARKSESGDDCKIDRPKRRLLKPVVDDARGDLELQFYERVFDASRADVRLRKLVPEFFGCVDVSGKGKYMKLADLTAEFEHPCVADIKMGRQTYDPHASAAKQARELKKYPQMSEVGFKICGMQVYNPSTHSTKTFDRTLGRSVTLESAPDMLATFLNLKNDDSTSRPSPKLAQRSAQGRILDAFLERLGEIRAYMEAQSEFHFYCTSLLFVYDGADLLNELVQDTASPRVGVYMIDFGHVFPAAEVDAGYAYGVGRLCDAFRATKNEFIE